MLPLVSRKSGRNSAEIGSEMLGASTEVLAKGMGRGQARSGMSRDVAGVS